MSSLIEKLNNFAVGAFSNRIDLAAKGFVVSGTYLTLENGPLYLPLALAGAFLTYQCRFVGLSAIGAYERTKKNIKRFNRFDDRVARVLFSSSRLLHGYCEEQGIYLAARDLGFASDFRRLKKKYSKNKIPNF